MEANTTNASEINEIKIIFSKILYSYYKLFLSKKIFYFF